MEYEYDSDTPVWTENDMGLELDFQAQQNYDRDVRELYGFLNSVDCIVAKGDPNFNVMDVFKKKKYNLAADSLKTFFNLLEACRRAGAPMMFAEPQNAESSGVMLDFDIEQRVGHSQVTTETCMTLMSGVLNVIVQHLVPSEQGKPHPVHCLFTKKAQVTAKGDGVFKDGLHMLIPSIRLSRAVKRWLIGKIIDSGVLQSAFGGFGLVNNDPQAVLDKNSAHVPVFFVGCKSKPNMAPYSVYAAYTCKLSGNKNALVMLEKDPLVDEAKCNLTYEFSLNHVRKFIPKQDFLAAPQFAHEFNEANSLPEDDVEDDDEDIKLLGIGDPDTKYIRGILDVLDTKRAANYHDWFRVVCVLANMSRQYKPLALYFSRKCPQKFDAAQFEQIWDQACANPNKGLRLGTLIWMAKEDNPERFLAVRNASLTNILQRRIYMPIIEGRLEHYVVAELLYMCLGEKFVYEPRKGRGIWYEFMYASDNCRPGEVYKYRTWETTPDTLRLYISNNLMHLFPLVLDNIKRTKERSTVEMRKYHQLIQKNVERSARSLLNAHFKNGVCMEACQLFSRPGFGDKLDKDANILGVGNGLLVLGATVKFVAQPHDYLISKFTTVNYVPFDPYNPETKQVLLALRTMFPDNEPDTHEFLMHYLASTLDNHIKDSIFLMIIGGGSNGKSFLMELHKGTIGDIYSVKLPLEFFTKEARGSENAMPCMMQLVHARLAYLSESDRSTKLVLRKVKELTGAESIYSRQLHQEGINFKPRCHYIALSNNDFIIEGSDYGTWRRIYRIEMKHQFFAPNDKKYDPKNPRHKVADFSMGKHWPESEKIRSAYLSVLVWYYQSYQRKYRGTLKNVPCDTIRRETEEYHSTQDRMNQFINKRAVVCEDVSERSYLSDAVACYQKWYEYQFGIKATSEDAQNEFLSSKLGKFIKQSRDGYLLESHRILDYKEVPRDGERYFEEELGGELPSESCELPSESTMQAESVEQYYQRICNEYEVAKRDGWIHTELSQDVPSKRPHEFAVVDAEKIEEIQVDEDNVRSMLEAEVGSDDEYDDL